MEFGIHGETAASRRPILSRMSREPAQTEGGDRVSARLAPVFLTIYRLPGLNMYSSDELGIRRDGEYLTNFNCSIARQLIKHDGINSETWLELEGAIGDEVLPRISIPATALGDFRWVPANWGIKPIVNPVPNCEKDLKVAIQTLSEPETEDLYTHTGWSKFGNEWRYLHGGGSIGGNGNDPNTRVELPPDLTKFVIQESGDKKTAVRASLNLSTLGPAEICWPLLLAVYRAAIDECDFGAHLSGKTGTFKSEFCSLLQSHFGAEMDARHLPANWSSTGNALEKQAFVCKNAVLVVDDYVPTANAWHSKTLNKVADQLFRGQGNQAGRARLNDTSRLQTTYFPRGLVISSGEDIPGGQSLRARMLIADLSPGDIDAKKLTQAQDRRHYYPTALAAFLQHISKTLPAIQSKLTRTSNEFRDGHRDLGHARTPGICGELFATACTLLSWAQHAGYITIDEQAKLANAAEDAILFCGREQRNYLMDQNPADNFVDTVKQVLGAHLGHFRSKSGGIPEQPTAMGWTQVDAQSGIPSYKSSGPCIGWICRDQDEIYVDAHQFPFLQKHGNGKLGVSQGVLLKRLKDDGILTRTDDLRQRNTMRVTLGGAQRTVAVIAYPTIFGE